MNAPLTISLPAMRRDAQLRAASFDEAANTIEVVWTTGAKVRRFSWLDGAFDEELVVSPQSVRLDRLNAGAPFLNTHASYDLADVIGSVVPGSAKIVRGQGVARILLSDAPGDADTVAKIKAGVIRNVSVGYRVHRVEKIESDGDVPLHRVVDFEPLEISAVPIPADAGAQIRAGSETFPAIIELKGATKMPTKTNANPAADAATLEAERSRAGTITDLATRAGLPEMIAPAIQAGTTVDDFRAALFDRMVEDERRVHPGGPGQQIGAPATVADHSFDNRRAAAMASAILHRVDPTAFPLEAGAEVFVAMPLLEVARAAVEGRGVRTAGMSKMQIAAAALDQRSLGGLHGTSDFPAVLAGVTGKVLRMAYEAAPQTFRPLVRVTTVPDFKEQSRVSIGEAPALERVNEHGEFKRGTIGEGKETFRLATYGKVIGLTRQSIVNDDLSAFDRLPRAFGVQAAQLESDVVWAQIIGNPKMGDNVDLFHSDHKNLGTDLAIGEASVSEARKGMGLQTGLDGATALNLTPAYLIVPKAQETAALKFLTTITPAKTDDAVPRELRNLTVIAEPRLDLGIPRFGIAGNDDAFYFAASPSVVDIVELAYLEGQQGVFTETRMGFDIDGIEIKARLDVAAKVLDWRGLFKTPYDGPSGG
ncbi:prohead protease/major capsid protein fusion protein [Shinella pollutisoli]|uniref:Prohead protease/major capsid protein fusion protein n=1 Tax=Shinella pollutisoli TaxID=2250594 RepID=A0ABV7DIN0_9HYPH|nr:prohead protease/major capsid protein fusion protein [Shinella pollutisoli]